MPRPTVLRISEVHPRMRRIHVLGEVHPGELSERGYRWRGGEWVLDVTRPEAPGQDVDPFAREFEALNRLGYEFAQGDEWSPRELLNRLRKPGREMP